MSRPQQVLSVTLAILVLAACGWIAPQNCEASEPVCKMGCGLSSHCCCNLDGQKTTSEPVKVSLSTSPNFMKSVVNRNFLVSAGSEVARNPNQIHAAARNVPCFRGGLAFLGSLLI